MASLKLLTSMGKRYTGAVANLFLVLDSLSHKSVQGLNTCALLGSRCLSHQTKSLPTKTIPTEKHNESTLLTISVSLENQIVSSTNHCNASQYVCPSRLSQLFSQLVIGDNSKDIKSYYDCPVKNYSKTEIITPATPSQDKTSILEPPPSTSVQKEAKEIMRIRHKKMKKHKLRKLRKRMYFLWKKQKAARKGKRDAIYWKEISDIKQEATDFDAESFVRDQLQKARKGGFYMNIREAKSC